jgi:hypothetical protein
LSQALIFQCIERPQLFSPFPYLSLSISTRERDFLSFNMRLSFSTVCALLAVSVVRGAPALDAATLLDNAKKAQVLNAEFLALKATDPCQG